MGTSSKSFLEVAAAAIALYAAAAAGEGPAMEKTVSLIVNGDFARGTESWRGIDGARVRGGVIDAEAGGCRRALRLTVEPEAGRPPWDLLLLQSFAGALRRGDAVCLRAWARSPDRCRLAFVAERSAPPHPKCIYQRVRLGPEWAEYRFMGRAEQDAAPGESRVVLFLGYDPGVIEVAGVRVENRGDAPDAAFDQTIDYWGGEPPTDAWRPAAIERIERLRKGDLVVRVVDGAGRPVPGAVVRVEQTRHAFRFGTAAPARRFLEDAPDNLRFRQEVERLYNTVTFENDLKWPQFQGLDNVDRAMEWLKARGIRARGHCLLWGSYEHLAPAARSLRGAALRQACLDHASDYAARYRGRLYLWDVVNEAGSNTEVWESTGWDAFAEAFRRARAADPGALLCYNDYGIVDESPEYRPKVAARIRQLLDAGAPVDVLGIQGHMHTPLTPIPRVLEILDEWAAFGKRLEITEFDAGCPDDAVHARYVRDFMTAVFSHPQVDAFIMWGFWEGSHWRAKEGGAMFRRDWSKRPGQEEWERLVLDEWRTRFEGRADARGEIATRAFHGTHAVTAEAGGRRRTAEVEMSPGRPGRVELRLP
jgi:GH35 family endo-1,4-beta-xylanase